MNTQIENNTKNSEELNMENKIEDVNDKLFNLNINNDDKKSEVEKLEIDYSKILYYSLVFNDEEYLKVLSLIHDNTNIFFGIYKYTKDENIVIKEKSNEKGYDVKSDFSTILTKMSFDDKFIVKYNENNKNIEKTLYKLNDKFHTTMLYLGGKKDTRALEFEPIIGDEIRVKIISIGISNKFIVCGIKFDDKSIPYYGNPIQHITIGLKKTESSKFKLFPKDSPTAFEEGIKINLEKPLIITGKLVKECKEIKEK